MTLLQPIHRSRAHLLLNRAFGVPEEPTTIGEQERAGLALALSIHADARDLPVMLIAAEVLADEIAFAGGCAVIHYGALKGATGLSDDACNAVCMMVGARQIGFRDWATSNPGEDAKLVTITADMLQDRFSELLPE